MRLVHPNRKPLTQKQVRFTNSGTEACMGMLRLVRAYTGREKIIKFEVALSPPLSVSLSVFRFLHPPPPSLSSLSLSGEDRLVETLNVRSWGGRGATTGMRTGSSSRRGRASSPSASLTPRASPRYSITQNL